MSFIGSLPTDEPALTSGASAGTGLSSQDQTQLGSTAVVLVEVSDSSALSSSTYVSPASTDASLVTDAVSLREILLADSALGSSASSLSSEYLNSDWDSSKLSELASPAYGSTDSASLEEIAELLRSERDFSLLSEQALKIIPQVVADSDTGSLAERLDYLLEGQIPAILRGYRLSSWWLNVLAYVPAVIVQTSRYYRFLAPDPDSASLTEIEWGPPQIYDYSRSQESERIWTGDSQTGSLIEKAEVYKIPAGSASIT